MIFLYIYLSRDELFFTFTLFSVVKSWWPASVTPDGIQQVGAFRLGFNQIQESGSLWKLGKMSLSDIFVRPAYANKETKHEIGHSKKCQFT